MTFVKFCEAIIGRPLFGWEKKLAEFLEEHPDAKLLHPIARGACGKENHETTEKIDEKAERMFNSTLS